MHYHYYRQCRDAAWRILRDTGIDTMPVSVLKICRKLGITVVYGELDCGELGRCIIYNDKPYIFLRKEMSNELKRLVCAHELGHILLEHFEYGIYFSYTESDRKSGFENGAQLFAMRLVCPACVLWGCNAVSAMEIASICGIESDYANKRLRRMIKLYQKDKFLTSILEKDVYANFKPFIDKYNISKGVSGNRASD